MQIPLSIHVPEDEDVHIDLSTVRIVSYLCHCFICSMRLTRFEVKLSIGEFLK